MKRFGWFLVLVSLVGSTWTIGATAEGGLTRHEMVIPTANGDVRLWLLAFDATRFRLRVIDNPPAAGGSPRFGSLADAMRAARCIAGCNGSFFRFEQRPIVPVGLVVSDGRRVAPLERESWMKGVLLVRDGVPELVESAAFADEPRIDAALQSGPWLIRDRRIEGDLDEKRFARRTFVGRDAAGRWVIGAAEPCSLRDLARLLQHERVRAVLAVTWALNLDGGPSTGLWHSAGGEPFYFRDRWAVSNYIGLAPKP